MIVSVPSKQRNLHAGPSIKYLSERTVAELFARKGIRLEQKTAQRLTENPDAAIKHFSLVRRLPRGQAIHAQISVERQLYHGLDLDHHPYIPLSVVKSALRRLALFGDSS